MVDISSQNNKINVAVSSSGNTANTNVTPDYAQYYSEKSKEWAISNRIVDNTDYSSKYYANESKKQADISTAKTTEVIESGNTAVSNIENARDNAITDITNQENLSVDNVNTAGITQVTNVNSAGTTQINLAKEQVTLATNQANIAKEQATIATNKTSEVVASGNTALSNIDTAKTGAITDITNLKNTSVSNITTAKNNAITSITTQETTSKNNVVAIGNEQVERVNLTGVDNRTPIFTKSEIGTNEGVYQNVYDLKHSTFDRSKFTVNGSPTITDDGVASGFKKGNDLKFPAITVTDNSTIVIRTKIKTVPRASSSDTQGQCIFGFYKNDMSEYIDAYNLWNGINITLSYKHKGVDKAQGISVSTVPNTEYDYKVEITKNAIKCYLDGELKGQQLNLSFDMSLINNVIGSIGTGARKGLTPTRMKIYLPDFSITVDGKEVFSGNKTDIDTIKADNYEVVGSPVISDDGVASGFSVANYIKSNSDIAFTAGQTWEIDLKVNIKNSESGINKAQCLFQIYASNPSLNSLQAILYNNCVFWTCPTTPSGGATNRFLQFTSEFNISSYLNQDIWFKFIYNGTQYIFEWSADGINFTREVASTDSRQFTGTGTLNLGAMSIHQQGLQGSMDLNDTKVYINDNLLYQPCLKIPYTQSKTGSKIVDVAYRDRVIDLYEQQGQAGYYTIDEENQNFTLPMGEIYGMIEDKADKVAVEESLATKANITTPSIQAPYLKDTYRNGTSWYRIWSDGWCEQGGELSAVSSTSSYTINLLKPYQNNAQYNILGSTSPGHASNYYEQDQAGTFESKTSSSFVKHLGEGSAYRWYVFGFLN